MRGKCSGSKYQISDLGCPTSAFRGGLTLATGVRLDKFIFGAGFFEFGGQPGELWEDFVDQADFGG